MGAIVLHVKHASKVHDVSLDHDAQGLLLKQKLEEQTGVPVARQKVMVKGKQLQNDVSLSSLGIKDGQQLFMLGSVPKAEPESGAASASGSTVAAAAGVPKGVEVEGQEEEEEDRYPVGLVNVGNTCYANATLEALHTVPELNDALKAYRGSDGFLSSWGSLVKDFGYAAPFGTDAPVPRAFLVALRQRFPQFAEIGEEGFSKQQDAEEFWTQIMWELRKVEDPAMRNVVSSFDGKFHVSTDKPTGVEKSDEDFTKLMCHITIKTNFLKDGLRAGLVDELETAENSGETYKVQKQISRLPKYLTVQFVRFFWRRDTQKNSKILRKVAFPMNLDIGDLCTDDLQARMAPAREAYRELEGAIEENKRSARRAKFRRLDAVPNDPADADADPNSAAKRRAAAEAEQREEEREKTKLSNLRTQFREKIDSELASDSACSPHGLYELQAIVTHQGMSADSGHYQCFTRNSSKPNSWWRFNDDRVTEVDDDRIAQLAGGGASDSALILLYKSSEF